MDSEYIEILSDAIKEYLGNYEFDELVSRFGLKIEYQNNHPNRKKLVTEVINQKYRDINRRFLEAILPKLQRRCKERILNTTWEVNIFDEQMSSQLKSLQDFLAGAKKSVQQTQSMNRFFTAKEQLIKFLSNAQTVLMIVDTQVGRTTFDCIQKVQTPIRLLTRQTQQDLAASAGRYLAGYRAKGHKIETRRNLRLNDRFIVFNGRCWLSSCSLVDMGKVTLSLIECVDTKPVVFKEIGRKWREAKVYLN
jgi:hypothetical protein